MVGLLDGVRTLLDAALYAGYTDIVAAAQERMPPAFSAAPLARPNFAEAPFKLHDDLDAVTTQFGNKGPPPVRDDDDEESAPASWYFAAMSPTSCRLVIEYDSEPAPFVFPYAHVAQWGSLRLDGLLAHGLARDLPGLFSPPTEVPDAAALADVGAARFVVRALTSQGMGRGVRWDAHAAYPPTVGAFVEALTHEVRAHTRTQDVGRAGAVCVAARGIGRAAVTRCMRLTRSAGAVHLALATVVLHKATHARHRYALFHRCREGGSGTCRASAR